jgi:hypothetical protein
LKRSFSVVPLPFFRKMTILLGEAKSRNPPARARASSTVVGARSCSTPGRCTSPSTDTR